MATIEDALIETVIKDGVETEFAAAQVVAPRLKAVLDGDVKKGNRVKVVSAARPTVNDYKANGRKFTAQELEAHEVYIDIDGEFDASQLIDDIEEVQASGNLEAFTAEQGPALAEAAEAFVIHKLITGATNSSTVVIDTAAKAKAALRKLAAELDDAKVPASGRIAFVNGKFKELLIEGIGESNAVQATGDEMRKNVVAEYAGFEVVHTPLFPGVGSEPKPFADYRTPAVVIALHERAAGAPTQISKTKVVESGDSFARTVASLAVFGAGVTRPAAVRVHGVDVAALETA